jgi:hypothetical protein
MPASDHDPAAIPLAVADVRADSQLLQQGPTAHLAQWGIHIHRWMPAAKHHPGANPKAFVKVW